MEYIQATQATLKSTFLVHGEERGALPLMEKMKEVGIDKVYFPELHSSVNI